MGLVMNMVRRPCSFALLCHIRTAVTWVLFLRRAINQPAVKAERRFDKVAFVGLASIVLATFAQIGTILL